MQTKQEGEKKCTLSENNAFKTGPHHKKPKK